MKKSKRKSIFRLSMELVVGACKSRKSLEPLTWFIKKKWFPCHHRERPTLKYSYQHFTIMEYVQWCREHNRPMMSMKIVK